MKTLYEKTKNCLRNLLNIRQKRKAPPVGSRPMVNACICRGTFKMLVTHEIDNGLWQWLALHGWRKISVPDDRRRYRRLPKEALKILLKTPPEALDSVHARMLAAVAKARPGRSQSSASTQAARKEKRQAMSASSSIAN